MNEEKILDDINFCLEGEYITPEHYEAIQGLLDLYQTKTEQLETAMNSKYEEVLEKTFQKYIDKDFVSKDKIREFALSESQAETYNFKTISLDRLLKFLEEE